MKQVYELCGDGEVRNQYGQCWGAADWEKYCTDKVGVDSCTVLVEESYVL